MKRYFSLIVYFCLALLSVSCVKTMPELDMNGGSETIQLKAGSCTERISFSTNVEWFAEVNAPWLTISPSQGTAGDAVVKLTADSNPNYESRSAEVIVHASSLTLVYKVIQAEKSGFILSDEEYCVGSAGGNVVIPVKSNVPYVCEVDPSCGSWISISQLKSIQDCQLIVNVKESASHDERIGNIHISYEDQKSTITIRQSQLDEVYLGEKEFQIGKAGGNLEVPIMTNIKYTCEVLGQAKDWISVISTQTKGMDEYKMTLLIKENVMPEGRVGQVKILGANKESYVTITQLQKDEIIVSQKEFQIGSDGGNFKIPIQSNTEYSCKVIGDANQWLSIAQMQTKDLENHHIVLSAKNNTTYDKRRGQIKVTGAGKEIDIDIVQSQLDEILFEKKAFEQVSAGGEIVVPIQTNIEYECNVIGEADQWITIVESQTKGLADYKLILSIAQNNNYEGRVGQVRVFGAGKESFITITQYQKDEILLEKTSYEFDAKGGAVVIPVQSNILYTVSVAESAKTWLHLAGSKSMDDSEIQLLVDENTSYDDRSGEIILNGNGIEKKISVVQSRVKAIIPEKSEYKVESKATRLEIPVKTNVEYTVTIPQETQKWISIIQTKSLDARTIILSVSENMSIESRNADITLESEGLAQSFHIVQEGIPVPEMIDMGLSVKWASFNVGAMRPDDVGKYYGWGELNGYPRSAYHSYNWGSYLSELGSGMWSSSDAGTSSDPLRDYVYPNYKEIDAVHDAAYNTYGDLWRMPTAEEFKELVYSCSITSDVLDGVAGYYFTSNINKNKIFIPESGYLNGSDKEYANDIFCWSSSPGKRKAYYAVCLYNSMYDYNLGRSIGLPIRPVYGVVKSLPDVSMDDVVVESDVIEFKGYVNNDGGAPIIEKGFVYSTGNDPKLGNGTIVKSDTDNFRANASGFSPNTTYHVRAYAKNMMGTSYSEVKSFLTKDVNYTVISNEQELLAFASLIETSDKPLYGRLAADIKLTEPWVAMGTANKPFNGIFDGNNHRIEDIGGSTDNAGVFGVISEAIVKNLTVAGTLSSGTYMGGIAGKALHSTIDNCISEVVVSSGKQIGGIVGYAENCTISNCGHINGNLGDDTSAHVGGIAGNIKLTSIFNCYNKGDLFGYDCYGGIVGYSDQACSVINCFNTGSFRKCYRSETAGGIVGYNCGTITNCYSTGSMSSRIMNGDSGMVMNGGVVGYNHTDTNCYCCYFLKQNPINKTIDFVGDFNWGTCNKCGSFDASGSFTANNLSCNGDTYYLRTSLNQWVNKNNSSKKYKQWRTDMSWPEFVD